MKASPIVQLKRNDMAISLYLEQLTCSRHPVLVKTNVCVVQIKGKKGLATSIRNTSPS